MRRALSVGLTVVTMTLAGACGSTPSSPSAPALTLAGAWSGTWDFVTAGATVTDTVVVTLSESNGIASGHWTAVSGANGQLSLPVAQTATGTITITTALIVPCSTASISVSATESATTLDFTLAPIPSSGNCQWPTSNHFVLHKQ
ncbi:MAG TPA: hypothetical protein VLT86_13225 [Vicinamibacterales bacterium]|nr:hypothetical protein [Vicinamibacterales bacterium]